MKRIVFAIIAILGIVGFTYYVEVEDETNLAEQVQTAIDAWLVLDDTLEFEEVETIQEAESIIRLGDASKFGPDLLSLTSQKQDEQRQTVLLIAPVAEANQRVLRHEVGLLLNLAISNQGIMNPAVLAEDSSELTEVDAQTLSATVNAAREDINRDGKIDYYDLVALAQAFGTSNFSSAADLNEDGVVDNTDLALLQKVYSFSPPSANPPGRPSDSISDPAEDLLEPTPDPSQDEGNQEGETDSVSDESVETEGEQESEESSDTQDEADQNNTENETDEGSSSGRAEEDTPDANEPGNPDDTEEGEGSP